MKIYKTCCEGNWCAFDSFDHAKEMIICDVECDDDFTKEEVGKYRKEIDDLKEEDLGDKVYQAGPYSIETGEMDEEEFNNLPEFDGY